MSETKRILSEVTALKLQAVAKSVWPAIKALDTVEKELSAILEKEIVKDTHLKHCRCSDCVEERS